MYMRAEITLVVLVAAVLAVIFIEKRRPRLRFADVLLLLSAGLALTALSLFYVETRYSGTVLQDFRGWPRAFYYVPQSGEGREALKGNHFQVRFFIENLVLYTGLLTILWVLFRRLGRSRSGHAQIS
jgi:hypothetical protein